MVTGAWDVVVISCGNSDRMGTSVMGTNDAETGDEVKNGDAGAGGQAMLHCLFSIESATNVVQRKEYQLIDLRSY